MRYCLTNLIKELCQALRSIPGILKADSITQLLFNIRQEANNKNFQSLIAWLDHKDANPWILKCLCWPFSKMNRSHWFSTSFTTNIGESAHAISNREGIALSLVTAIQKGRKVDERYLSHEIGVEMHGIQARYGTQNLVSRTKLSKNRKMATIKKTTGNTKMAKENKIKLQILEVAQTLKNKGISSKAIEKFLEAAAIKSDEE